MHDPAFIALACSLGPVAYAAASVLAAVIMLRVSIPIKNQGDVACLGFLALVWPLLAAFVAVAGACIGLGKLAVYLGRQKEGRT